jgi:hypothetical protein
MADSQDAHLVLASAHLSDSPALKGETLVVSHPGRINTILFGASREEPRIKALKLGLTQATP